MAKSNLNSIQDIHYSRKIPSCGLNFCLSVGEFFYKNVINLKNFLYRKNILKEKEVPLYVICVGNLTTGGVGKTPIVAHIANNLSQKKPLAIISRGYGAEISNKEPLIIKDFKEIKFSDGTLCGDEPYQLAQKTDKNVAVITCRDRKKSAELAVVKFGVQTVIMDDGFSNRKIKKDKTIIVIDSKMRFGNGHLLPKGPLREPVSEIKRADEIVLVDKGDEKITDAIEWVKKFNKPTKLCKMMSKRIYNIKTKADVIFNKPLNTNTEENFKPKAIAFCAIGQPRQFFDFANQYYDIVEKVSYNDHHKYDENDIKRLMLLADENNANIFITTQKDETKLSPLVNGITGYNFNVMELMEEISEI